MTDEELMRCYQQGDAAAFETLYRRFAPRLLGYLKKKCFAGTDPEEVFQNVVMKLHRSRDRYDARYPFLAWLFTIAQSVWTDQLRSQRRSGTTVEFDETKLAAEPLVEAAHAELSLEKLSAKDRELLESRFVREEGFAEIAARLNLSEVGARKRVSRAVQALKKMMRKAHS